MTDQVPTQTVEGRAQPVALWLPADIEAHGAKLRAIDAQVTNVARWMDTYCVDPIAGFVFPVLGDLATSTVKIWVFRKARAAGVPQGDLVKIAGCAVADFVIGAIPVLGDMADVAIVSNLYAAGIISQHVEDQLHQIEDARTRAGLLEGGPVEHHHPVFGELRRTLSLAA